MSSTKKKTSKTKQSKNEQGTSEQSPSPQLSSDDGTKGPMETKPSEKGFSILGSLAKFMSREKKRESLQPQPLEPLVEQEEEQKSMSQEPVYSDMSSQTSELSIHRSSTLMAISSAVDTLQELRTRITLLAEKKERDQFDLLQPEETQTSNFYIPEENTYSQLHDPDLLLRNRTLPADYEDTRYDNSRQSALTFKQIKVIHRDRPLSLSHVSFQGNPEIYEIKTIYDVPTDSKKSYNTSAAPTNDSITNVQDEDSFDNGKTLFQSTPNIEKGNSKHAKLPPLKLEYKSEVSQTEPDVKIRGTQTSSPHVVNNDQSAEHPDSLVNEQSLIRKILTDRGKCPKCDLFELMFLHGGEKVLNDKEMLDMFKKHMNSHLLKAREDLDKQYKWPGRITQIEDVTETPLNPGKNVDQERVQENVVPTRNPATADNIPLNRHHDSNDVRHNTPQDEKLGTTSQRRQVTAVNGEVSRRVIEESLNVRNGTETGGLRRDLSQTRHRISQPYSHSLGLGDQPLMNFGGLREDCSEEIIIRRNHCREGRNRRDSTNCEDGYCYLRHAGNEGEGSNSHRRYRNQFDRKDMVNGKNCQCQCYCERIRSKSESNLSNCEGCFCNDGPDRYYCNSRSKKDNSKLSSHSRQRENSTEMEFQLKWFIKGMLTGLKGHFSNNNSNKRSGNKTERVVISSDSGHEETPKKTENGSTGKNKKTNTEDSIRATDNSPPATKEENSLPKENGNSRQREGSVLSSMAFSIIKDSVKKGGVGNDQKDVQEDKQDHNAEKQDIAKDGQAMVHERSHLGVNNQNGRSNDEIENEAVFHKNFNLKDPSIQELIQDVLSVVGVEKAFHERGTDSEEKNDCETDVNLTSNEVIQRLCEMIFAATPSTRRTSTHRTSPTSNSGESYKEGGTGTSGDGYSTQQRTACSYFFPLCSDVINTGNQCCSYQEEPCYCLRRKRESSSRNTGGILPLQETFKRNRPKCYDRLKTRQESISNCMKNGETQRKHRMHALLNALNTSRTPAVVNRRKGSILCNFATNIFTSSDENAAEPVTYVVPRSQVYWQSF